MHLAKWEVLLLGQSLVRRLSWHAGDVGDDSTVKVYLAGAQSLPLQLLS